MKRLRWSVVVRSLCASCLIFTGMPAQGKPAAPPEPEERAVQALGAKELDAFAAQCRKGGYPTHARRIWLEVLGEYDEDDEGARKGTGFVRHGKVWQFDLKYEFPTRDEPDAKAAKSLQKRFATLSRKLGAAHLEAAVALRVAGKEVRAAYHFHRALRFLPDDAKVREVSGMGQFEGVTACEVDLGILRRSRKLQDEVDRLRGQRFEGAATAKTLLLLERAGLEHTGWKTENFTVYGDWEPEVLAAAAEWSERALRFCRFAYRGAFEPARASIRRRTFVYLRTKESWTKLIEANVETIGYREARFAVEHASSTTVDDVHTAGVESVATVLDLAARWVVQDYSGLHTDGLREGIGHAVVGMFFGRNLSFSIGQQDPDGTVSGRRDARMQLWDIDTWVDLAVESAWSKTGTRAAQLPLVDAAKFSSDARIKAWSFCDYLLRRDPQMLRHLDATASRARHENEVPAEFERRSELGLDELEAGWRRFWSGGSALQRAVFDTGSVLEAVSKDATRWVDALNEARATFGGKAVGWSARLSIACRQHAEYLRANRDQRGPGREHWQVPGKQGYSHSGQGFATSAVVWVKGRDPKKALEQWMLIPGYRDVILNQNLANVGVFAERGVVVLDGRRGLIGGTEVRNITFPFAQGGGRRMRDPVPTSVKVELLGPEVAALLAEHDREGQKEVGLPLTAHFYHGASHGVTCAVTARGEPIEGWLVRGRGACGRTSAPGLWVFYPAEPLPKNVDITAKWSWPGGGAEVVFTAR